MSVDVGKGTRLLCVEALPAHYADHGIDPLKVGTIYTCEEASRLEECLRPSCGLHGPNCHAGCVLLKETGRQIIHARYFGAAIFGYCLAQFTPIGPGEALPAEILAALDVTSPLVPLLEPEPA